MASTQRVLHKHSCHVPTPMLRQPPAVCLASEVHSHNWEKICTFVRQSLWELGNVSDSVGWMMVQILQNISKEGAVSSAKGPLLQALATLVMGNGFHGATVAKNQSSVASPTQG